MPIFPQIGKNVKVDIIYNNPVDGLNAFVYEVSSENPLLENVFKNLKVFYVILKF